MSQPTIKDFSKISTADLLDKLAHALEATAASLYEAAAIWNELNRRGEAIPRALLAGILQWLPRIARGQLAAETIIAFAGQPSLIGSMAGMPLDEQRKYAGGELVSVATFDEDNKPVTEAKPFTDLSAREVKLVFDQGRVRPLNAQINSLKRSRTETKTKPPYSSVTMEADVAAGLAVIGHARIALSDPRFVAVARKLGWRLERVNHDRRSTQAENRPQA